MKYIVTRRWYTCQEVEAQDEEEALQTAREEPILSDEFYDANDNEIEAEK